jgi:putative metallohydrolase (TIGR04338 family)
MKRKTMHMIRIEVPRQASVAERQIVDPPAPGKLRDQQRAAVYKAEGEAGAARGEEMSLKAIQDLMTRVMGTVWFQKNWPDRKIFHLYDGRRRSAACGGRLNGGIFVKLPKWSRREMIVLHEMAHGVQPRNSAAHGPEFCMIYLAFVRRFLGEAQALELEAKFKQHGVAYRSLRYKLSTET